MASETAAPPGSHEGGASPWAPTPYRVVERAQETADTATLALEPVEPAPPPGFVPGQFHMLYAPDIGEAAISISGATSDPRRRVHTIRSAGRVTDALTKARVGDVVGVRGPYGRGWPLREAEGKDLLLVVGGLGLPPLRPVLYEVLAHRDRFRRVEIAYGARTPKDLVYYDEIQAWRTRKDLRFQVTVDRAGVDWYGDVGIVSQRIPDMRFDPSSAVAFLCGPEIMMRGSAQALVDRGMSRSSVYVSMERNMKCGFGQCGHCQFGPFLLCRDGPVLPYASVERYFALREL